ncbi:unannotated protein [freshwater metagenome]|uniref:Unannotated protein n=1 Tax=freshwater metagenome TaxID=449393 RepID=A0A6J7UVB8_9ZZZZ
MVVPKRTTRIGLAVSLSAVAGGVTTRAKSNSVPTTCTAIVTTKPISTKNAMPRAFTATPFASATSGLTDANISGRAITASTRARAIVNKANTLICPVETANKLPNNTLVTVVLDSVASEANRIPKPVAKASTVPVAVARSEARFPRAPITSAPPTQKTASPRVGDKPSRTAPVAPGNPIWPRACAANSPSRTTTK